jgi:Flp pilus assembly protein TadG
MKKCQAGATAVEFALVAALFLTVLLAIMDFGRILFTWNAVAEATRLGARVSVVCDKGAARVLADMQKFVPQIDGGNLTIQWYQGNVVDNGCTSANCTGVAVSVTGLTISPLSPLTWIGFSTLNVPGFTTYLPREIMGQDPGSGTVCN